MDDIIIPKIPKRAELEEQQQPAQRITGNKRSAKKITLEKRIMEIKEEN